LLHRLQLLQPLLQRLLQRLTLQRLFLLQPNWLLLELMPLMQVLHRLQLWQLQLLPQQLSQQLLPLRQC
jgi:hypothetical protein